VVVVSQPDRRRGRGRKLSPSPVAEVALREGLPLLRPEKVGEVEEELHAQAADLGVVVAFGQFIPKRIRELPALGYCINGHASLLPRWRGAAPIQHAILAGDTRTGVSVMRVEKEMDAGAFLLQRELAIGQDEIAGELAVRLAGLTAEAIREAVDRLAVGGETWTKQDVDQVRLAPKITREDARLDWSEPAEDLVRRVRAMAPSPGAFTELDGSSLRVLAANVEPGAPATPPGTVRSHSGLPVAIATARGWLVPTRLQRAGGKPLDVEAFVRGFPLPDGSRLT
jgi:methionyl-tRNA formyltransferase